MLNNNGNKKNPCLTPTVGLNLFWDVINGLKPDYTNCIFFFLFFFCPLIKWTRKAFMSYFLLSIIFTRSLINSLCNCRTHTFRL